ncbi:uncharacterized protein LOC142823290 [Pelodiscus sinensis]|uniref:uncharacterized protein LOC142823290 n=1 Tax=Pelodiscus sinensis TaxID=13735 RepID=UPI003F6ACB7C
MAATGPKDTEQLLDELICSICRDYFTDPVITICDHNFCRGCITQYWERGKGTSCPECRKACSATELIPNVELRKAARKAKRLPPAAPKSAVTDSGEWKIHRDTAKPFSEEAQSRIYVVCKESQVHKDPTIICLEDAAQDREATGRPKTLSRCEEEKENFLKPSKINSESQTEAYKQEHRYNWKKHKVTLGFALGFVLAVLVLGLLIVGTVLAVLLSGRSPVVQGPACPDGWVGYQGKCYYLSEGERNWTYSRSRCSALGASLAGIDNEQEMAFLLRYKGKFDHWIGLQRGPGQPWKWTNGTEFNNWFGIEGGGDCAYLNENGVGSLRCASERPWICSKPDALTAAKETPAGGGS